MNADDKVLQDHLKAYEIAPPRSDLKAQILAVAKETRAHPPIAANDRARKKILAFGAIAALFIMSISVFYIQPASNPDDALWADAASDMGIEDLYEWVNG